MSHLDDEALAALVAGDGSDGDRAHAAACASCAVRLASFEELAGALRAAGPVSDLEAPPARVWDAITAELGMDSGAGRASRGAAWKPWQYLSVAASVAVLTVAGGFAFGLFGGSSDVKTVASAPLESLTTGGAAGDAKVERLADGTTVLVIDTDYDAPADGALEVWLIDPEIKGMISVGYLSSDHGEFVLPPGFDLAGHPIVDISVEPHDGVPTHSGVSVTRGVLTI